MSDAVNPEHYKRGPKVKRAQGQYEPLEAIEVIRWIRDPRLANAIKYIWRVAFGGKHNNVQDIMKAVWYLTDWLDHPVDTHQ